MSSDTWPEKFVFKGTGAMAGPGRVGEKRQDTESEEERRGPAWFRLNCWDTGGLNLGGDRHACCRQRPIKVGCFGPRQQRGQKGTKAGVGGEWMGLRLAACLLASAASYWLIVELWGSCEVPGSKIGCFSHSSFLTSSFLVVFLKNYTYLILCACQSSEGGLWESVPAFQCVDAGDRNSGHQSCSKPLYPQSHLAGLFLVREYLSTNFLVRRPFVSLFPLPTLSPLWYCPHLIDCPRFSGRSLGIGLCFDYRYLLEPKTVMYAGDAS